MVRSEMARTRAARSSIAVMAFVLVSCADAHGADAQRWTPDAIATDQYESSPTFTPDGQEMYFMRSDRSFGRYRLMVSRCEKGEWSAPEPPPFAAPEGVLEGDPFVTRDGRRLYFVSARESDDPEDLDIWYVERTEQGTWREPIRLPRPVNSPASELLPRVTGQGRIYFGSGRAGGYGQSDIYVAALDEKGAWRVANVGPPISTPANEYEADVAHDERTLVVVADRGDRSHLYRFTQRGSGWVELGRIPARMDVFQVGPLLSPRGDRLLFAQAEGARSGEIFLIDLESRVDADWPPRCPR